MHESDLVVVDAGELGAVGARAGRHHDTARAELAAVQVGAAAAVRQSIAGRVSSAAVLDVERHVLQQRTFAIVPQLQSVGLYPGRRHDQVSLHTLRSLQQVDSFRLFN